MDEKYYTVEEIANILAKTTLVDIRLVAERLQEHYNIYLRFSVDGYKTAVE